MEAIKTELIEFAEERAKKANPLSVITPKNQIEAILDSVEDVRVFFVKKYLENNGRVYLCVRVDPADNEGKDHLTIARVSKKIFNWYEFEEQDSYFMNMSIYAFVTEEIEA